MLSRITRPLCLCIALIIGTCSHAAQAHAGTIPLSRALHTQSVEPDSGPSDSAITPSPGSWTVFTEDAKDWVRQTSEIFIAAQPDSKGAIEVTVRTTIHNISLNYATWTTTKTIYCDDEKVAFIGPDYSVAHRGESISQQAKFTVSGGGTHHITSTETEFRGGTELTAGWDFYVTAPFVITSSAGPGGSIDPSAPVYAEPGTSISYRIDADQGYRIGSVIVDGAAQQASRSYTFDGIDGDHDIEATFIKTWNVVFVDGLTGELLSSAVVDDGAAAGTPSAPHHDGYRFVGWSEDSNRVSSDLRITADYIRTHTVIFQDHLGNELSRQTIDDGQPATDPGLPDRDGYAAVGWDASFVSITDDLVIQPVYEPIVSIRVPAVLPCVIAPSGEVIEPTDYEIENLSVVPVICDTVSVHDLVPETHVSVLEGSNTVFSTDTGAADLRLAASESKRFTWHIGDLNRRDHGTLIDQALDGEATICRLMFTFEADLT